MVTKEEQETDKEHECHKHEEKDVELCGPIWQVPLGEKQENKTLQKHGRLDRWIDGWIEHIISPTGKLMCYSSHLT